MAKGGIALSKLIKCKTCGAEIAKTANRCPQCGARQHQVALSIVAIIIVFTVFAVIFISVNSWNAIL